MKEFIEQNGGLIASVALVLIAINTALVGVSAGLQKIADKTANKTDDKVLSVINGISASLKKIIDLISANTNK